MSNYFSGVLKVLEIPKKINSKKVGTITKIRVQLPQIRKQDQVIDLVFWGNQARDIEKCYKVNDYILVEGYISLRDKNLDNIKFKKLKTPEITVFKIYPFLLTSKQETN